MSETPEMTKKTAVTSHSEVWLLPLHFAADLLTMREYHCLLQLLCPDFPLELTQKAARYVSRAPKVNSAPSGSGFWEITATYADKHTLGESKTDREETGIWRGVNLGFAPKHNIHFLHLQEEAKWSLVVSVGSLRVCRSSWGGGEMKRQTLTPACTLTRHTHR